MALMSATVPFDQVEEAYYRESEFLDIAIDLTADDLALARPSRKHFQAAVSKSLNEETDRILLRIARGSPSAQ